MRLIDVDALMVVLEKIPAVGFKNIDNQTYTLVLLAQVLNIIKQQPTIEERKTGKWEERKVSSEKVIDEWQSCKCSVCGRYDTRPYLYYFDEPRFCSWCGSDMRA